MPDPSQDLRNKVLGRKAEKLTRHYLRRRGYKIVAKNYMTPFGEADIVARAPDGTYCFVEVKARTSGQLSSGGGHARKTGALPHDRQVLLRTAAARRARAL